MNAIKYFVFICGVITFTSFSFANINIDNTCETPDAKNVDAVIAWKQSQIDPEIIHCLKENIDNIDNKYLLSLLYINGRFVNEDFNYSIQLLTEAGNQGQSLAAHDLGAIYESGLKTLKPNLDLAIYWYEKAISSGYNFSIDNLSALLLKKGDYENALYWALQGSELENPKSNNNLSIIYLNGLGIEKDYIKGFNAANKASEQGSIASTYTVAILLASKIIGIPYNTKKAYELSVQACLENFALACNLYATFIYQGIGTDQDSIQALNILQKLAEQDVLFAKINLADFYYYDSNFKNDELAYKWYLSALEQLYGKKSFYREGYTTTEDLLLEIQEFKKSRDFHNTEFIFP